MRNTLVVLFMLALLREIWMRWSIDKYLSPYNIAVSSAQQSALLAFATAVVFSGLNKVCPNDYLDAFSELGATGLVVLSCFVADRTNWFGREGKSGDVAIFLALVTAFLVYGAMGRRRMSQGGALTTERTLEWKGVMQAVLLLYHFTGVSSKNLLVYQCIRLLVASYVFLTGYGHTSYFLKTGDFSCARFGQVIFRLNFATLALCWVMGRPYQHYYFVPVVTFWFLVVWGVLALGGSSLNSVRFVVPAKVVLIFIGVYFVFFGTTEPTVPASVFKKVFTTWPMNLAFPNLGDAWFRLRLDAFSAPTGMAVAYLVHKIQECPATPRLRTITSYRLAVLGYAVVCFAAFLEHATKCDSKEICNETHTVMSPFVILAFVGALSIAPDAVRNFSSPVFSYLGRISLELFLLQYHIFMADDTKKLLVLVPGYPVVNFVVVSALFIVAAHVLSSATNSLTDVVVEKKTVERSLGGKLLEMKQFALVLLVACAVPALANK